MWKGIIRRAVRESFMNKTCDFVVSIVYLGIAGMFGFMQPVALAAEDDDSKIVNLSETLHIYPADGPFTDGKKTYLCIIDKNNKGC